MMPDAVAWARPWAATRAAARRIMRAGAWYPVLQQPHTDRVLLDVHDRPVAVPSRLVEFRQDRPSRFTVVYRARNEGSPVDGTDQDLGRQYAVCPGCGHRIRLHAEPFALRCDACSFFGEVAWGETG